MRYRNRHIASWGALDFMSWLKPCLDPELSNHTKRLQFRYTNAGVLCETASRMCTSGGWDILGNQLTTLPTAFPKLLLAWGQHFTFAQFTSWKNAYFRYIDKLNGTQLETYGYDSADVAKEDLKTFFDSAPLVNGEVQIDTSLSFPPDYIEQSQHNHTHNNDNNEINSNNNAIETPLYVPITSTGVLSKSDLRKQKGKKNRKNNVLSSCDIVAGKYYIVSETDDGDNNLLSVALIKTAPHGARALMCGHNDDSETSATTVTLQWLYKFYKDEHKMPWESRWLPLTKQVQCNCVSDLCRPMRIAC